MEEITLYQDQVKALDILSRFKRTYHYYNWGIIMLLVDFKPEYINTVIPDGTTSKKYDNHKKYQEILRKDLDMREALETYHHYNGGNRDAMIKALVTGNYGSAILFKKGQAVVVKDGNVLVGILDQDVIEGETIFAKIYSDSWFKNLIGDFPVKKMEGIKQWR